MHRLFCLLFVIAALQTAAADSAGQRAAETVEGLSPDGKYGVTIPKLDLNHPNDGVMGNRLIETNTWRVVAAIDTGKWNAYQPMNRGGWRAIWNNEGTLLCFCVTGKWTSQSLTILKLKNGGLLWQNNLSPACQKAILKKTRAADSTGYAREKKANKGSGAAYPEGFVIDVALADKDGPLRLPLNIHVDLTSNVKAGTEPEDPQLPLRVDSWLNAALDEDGNLTFGELHLGRRPTP